MKKPKPEAPKPEPGERRWRVHKRREILGHIYAVDLSQARRKATLAYGIDGDDLQVILEHEQ